MLVAFMVVVMVLMTGNTFSRIWLLIAFEGFSRTQRFAFQARGAPIELTLPRNPDQKTDALAGELSIVHLLTAALGYGSWRNYSVWPGEYLISW